MIEALRALSATYRAMDDRDGGRQRTEPGGSSSCPHTASESSSGWVAPPPPRALDLQIAGRVERHRSFPVPEPNRYHKIRGPQ